MHWNIDGAAATIHRVAGLLDHAENLVSGGEFGAVVPELEIGAAQRGPRNSNQYFARRDFRNRDALDRNALVAVEDETFAIAAYPVTAPSVSPDTSQR
jgi:hypothetical protein